MSKNRMATCVVTLRREDVTSLTTSVVSWLVVLRGRKRGKDR